jgi:Reverse transcriptase (RNA-dependent DNA polymerase)
VKWENFMSDEFKCINSLRQGSPLSPFLFSIYIDNVLKDVQHLLFICRIEGRILNVLAYADDTVLCAPTWRG